MPSRLIELQDGTLVEVETTRIETEEIVSTLAKRVDSTLEQITPVLRKICQPVAALMYDEKAGKPQAAEVEVALGFEVEGNLYVAKAKSSASLVVRLRFGAEGDESGPTGGVGGHAGAG